MLGPKFLKSDSIWYHNSWTRFFQDMRRIWKTTFFTKFWLFGQFYPKSSFSLKGNPASSLSAIVLQLNAKYHQQKNLENLQPLEIGVIPKIMMKCDFNWRKAPESASGIKPCHGNKFRELFGFFVFVFSLTSLSFFFLINRIYPVIANRWWPKYLTMK